MSEMAEHDNSVPALSKLLEQRLAVVGDLAYSLEASRVAIGRRDAEAIARGAEHQAELCRQWNRLEEQLRAEALRRRILPVADGDFSVSTTTDAAAVNLAAEWETLSARIRYLTRVHASLLRHMQRSLDVLGRMIASCAPMYACPPGNATPQALPNQASLPGGN
jgi:hypothetical protein